MTSSTIFSRWVSFALTLLLLFSSSTAFAVNFGEVTSFPFTTTRGFFLGVGDVNEDGKPDIVHTHYVFTPSPLTEWVYFTLNTGTIGNPSYTTSRSIIPFANRELNCMDVMGRYVLVGYREASGPSFVVKLRVYDYITDTWLADAVTTASQFVTDCKLMALKDDALNSFTPVIVVSQAGLNSKGYGVYTHGTPFPVWQNRVNAGSPALSTPGKIVQRGSSEFFIKDAGGTQRGEFLMIRTIGVRSSATYNFANFYQTNGAVWSLGNTLWFFSSTNGGLSSIALTGSTWQHNLATAQVDDWSKGQGIASQFNSSTTPELITPTAPTQLTVYNASGAVQQTIFNSTAKPVDSFFRYDINFDGLPDLLMLRDAPGLKEVAFAEQTSCNGVDQRCLVGDHCALMEEAPDKWVCVPNCVNNSTCPGATYCLNGRCELPCANNSECPTGLACVAGQCQPCVNNSQCDLGFECRSNVCTSACEVHNDCEFGEFCNAGMCEDRYRSSGLFGASHIPVDFDVDGLLDVVTSSGGNPMTISVAVNNPADPGTFQTLFVVSQSLSVFESGSDIAVGDCDNDGYMDVFQGVSSSAAPGRVITFKNQAGTNLAAFTDFSVPGIGLKKIIPSDIDGDGNLDLVVLPLTGSVNVYQGDGQCGFTHRWQSSNSYTNAQMLVGNVDGIPGDDVIVGFGNNLHLYRDFRPKTWQFNQFSTSSAPAVGLGQIALGNTEDAGNLEVVATNAIGTTIYRYDLMSGFVVVASDVSRSGTVMAVGNVDSGPSNEVVIASGTPNLEIFGYRVATVYGKAGSYPVYAPTALSFSSMRIFDANGDGFSDVVAFGASAIHIFPGRAQTHTPPLEMGFTTPRNYLQAEFADVDKDGILDIVYLARGSSVFGWLKGPTFAEGSNSPMTVSSEFHGFKLADLDSDGDLDVVFFADDPALKLHTMINDPVAYPRFSGWQEVLSDPGIQRWSAILGAFAGTGRADVVVLTDGQDHLMKNDDGNLLAPSWTSVDDLLSYTGAAGDINGDGHLDFVVGGSPANGLAAWWYRNLGDGAGFAKTSIAAANILHKQWDVELRDFNLDGKLDIAYAQSSAPNVVYLQDGGGFPDMNWGPNLHGEGLEVSVGVVSGDWNFDGYPDLAFISDSAGQTVRTYINRGESSIADFGFYGNLVDSGTRWRGISSGDFDRDGDQDFILISGETGNHRLYMMRNTMLWPAIDEQLGRINNHPTGAVVYRPGAALTMNDGGTGRPITGKVKLPVILTDHEGDFANIEVEYQRRGTDVWTSFAAFKRLKASPEGTTHLVEWDTAGLPSGEYEVRVTVLQTPMSGLSILGRTRASSPLMYVIDSGCDVSCAGACVGDTCLPSCPCGPGEICFGDTYCIPNGDDPCDTITCLPGYECSNGQCILGCSDDLDCEAPSICFPDGCMDPSDLCGGVMCPDNTGCVQGSCIPIVVGGCNSDSDCAADEVCYEVSILGLNTCGPQDACELVDGVGGCPTCMTCFNGGCFEDPSCTTFACTPPEVEYSFGCALPPGYDGGGGGFEPCDLVVCGVNQMCIQGMCADTCSTDADCTPPQGICYDSMFCGPPNLCGGLVECPDGYGCFQGGCFVECVDDAECTLPSLCFNNLCRDGTDPCDQVSCPSGEGCYLGNCFPTCGDSSDCTPPYSYCFDSTVCLPSYDLCEGLVCPLGMACHQGQCLESCSGTDPCVMPYACYTEICAQSDCDITCPDGMSCYQNGCFTECSTANECVYYDECYVGVTPTVNDRCAEDACDNVFCLSDEACFGGVCYPFCNMDGSCDDPTHICFENFLCMPKDPCEGVYCALGTTCKDGTCEVACEANADCPGYIGSVRSFIEIAGSVNLATPWRKNAGVTWGDYNNDGCLDLALNTSEADGGSRLYESDCNGSFKDVTSKVRPTGGDPRPHFLRYGRERSIIWGDWDNDGNLDIARNTSNVINIYRNLGPPDYEFEMAHALTFTGMNVEGMGWIDFDGDGWLDLVAEDEHRTVALYRNNTAGGFTSQSSLLAGVATDAGNGDYCVVGDINLDSHVDILCRKPGTWRRELFMGKGDGTFNASNAFNQNTSENKGGVAICDLNNDGRFDIVRTDFGPNQIWLQEADGSFTPTNEPTTSSGFAMPSDKMNDVLCGDIDHDGLLDLFWIGEGGSYLFRNNSTLDPTTFAVTNFRFERKNLGIASASQAYSGAMADFNKDGTLDILVHANNRNELWQNQAVNEHYLMIRALVDLGGGKVRDGIGATVTIRDPDGRTIGIREVSGGRGRGSQDPAILHYGLLHGPDVPYELTVLWPHGKKVRKCVIPADIAGYKLIEIKDSDSNDTTLCETPGDWITRRVGVSYQQNGEFCFGGVCREESCDGVICPKGNTCYGGECVKDCTSCAPEFLCVEDACVKDLCNEGNFECPVDYACANGICAPDCASHSDCEAAEQCYQGVCQPTTCDDVVCPGSQVCHNGVCFNDCASCESPKMCIDGRCVRDGCEALDDTYNEKYIYRQAGGHITATRNSAPWFWPQPFVGVSGVSFEKWVEVSGTTVNNTDVPAAHTARVALYLDRELATTLNPEGRYVLWFNQGANTATQKAGSATYRIQVRNVEPRILLDDDNESYQIMSTDINNHYVVHAQVTNESNQTGGIAIGRLGSHESSGWSVEIDADFNGDIRRWEWVNPDGSIIALDPRETLRLSISSPDNKVYAVGAGLPCDTNAFGICKKGTSYCEMGEQRCATTVTPWMFEVCDGLDNNCDGNVDEVANMRFPGVEWRDDVSSWQFYTTLDKAESVQSAMNFTPRGGDDRDGSTDIQATDGTGSIQAWDRAVLAMHRDLRTGSLALQIANGLQSTGSMVDVGDYEVRTRLRFPGSETINEMFPAWWDDRRPSSEGDRFVTSFRENRMYLEWEIEQNGDGATARREADSVALMTRWSGKTATLSHFEVRYDWRSDADNGTQARKLKFGIHLPGQGFKQISRQRSMQFRITPLRRDETACYADGLTTVAGCGLGYYTCNIGGTISCSEPVDSACNRCRDADGDGFFAYDENTCPEGRDCNDNDFDINPNAPERCNGLDDDCDGLIDIKNDEAYKERWLESRATEAATCPAGMDECGPVECQFRNVCVCPDGPEDPGNPPDSPCYCGEGFTSAEGTHLQSILE